MALTPLQGIAVLKRKIAAMQTVPEATIEAAHRKLMPLIPVYTSTYLDAIEIQSSPFGAILFLTEAGLLDSARRKAAAITDRLNMSPEQYVDDDYPVRIESSGRPKSELSPSGRGAWSDTTDFARAFWLSSLNKAVKRR